MKLKAEGSFEELTVIMEMLGDNKNLNIKNVILEPNEDQTNCTLEVFFGEKEDSNK